MLVNSAATGALLPLPLLHRGRRLVLTKASSMRPRSSQRLRASTAMAAAAAVLRAVAAPTSSLPRQAPAAMAAAPTSRLPPAKSTICEARRTLSTMHHHHQQQQQARVVRPGSLARGVLAGKQMVMDSAHLCLLPTAMATPPGAVQMPADIAHQQQLLPEAAAAAAATTPWAMSSWRRLNRSAPRAFKCRRRWRRRLEHANQHRMRCGVPSRLTHPTRRSTQLA